MSQDLRGGTELEQRKRSMRLIGKVGAIGDLVVIAVFWFIPLDLGQTLYVVTLVLAISVVYVLWVTHVFLPKRWDRAAETSLKP